MKLTRIDLLKDKLQAKQTTIDRLTAEKRELEKQLAAEVAKVNGWEVGKKYYLCEAGHRKQICTIEKIGERVIGEGQNKVPLYVHISSIKRGAFWGTKWIYPSDFLELIPTERMEGE